MAENGSIDTALTQALEPLLRRLVREEVERALAERQLQDWLPLTEAARELGCTPKALRERIRSGRVPASTMSRKLYVKRSDIYEALERKRGKQ